MVGMGLDAPGGVSSREMSGAEASAAITSRGALDLAAAIRRRELTSVEVVSAHVERLTRTAPRLGAVVAERYQDALARAAEIDLEIARSALRRKPQELPPLLGVPFTVKESIAVEGMPNSAGVLARRDLRARQSATAVERLQAAGAIVLAVTNTSELTLWIESDNRVYGRTNNPYDPSRTAGGSSGGEGAVVAVGGSPFGVGADIGGSIRIPALFCGVFGHKPSSGLVPNTGVWPGAIGQSAPLLATGLLARRAEDLMPLLRIIAGPDGRDPTTIALELGDPAEISLEGLQVTTIEESGPHRPYGRALLAARGLALEALTGAGARVRTLTLPSRYEALLPFLTVLTEHVDADLVGGLANGRARALRERGRGVLDRRHTGTVTALLEEAGEPLGVREILFGGGRHTAPLRMTAGLDWLSGLLDAGFKSRQLARANDLARRVADAVGGGVLLHPAFPTLAPRHHHTYGRPWLLMPSAIFNLAGVPVTEVPLGIDPRSGLPVGLQVAAPHGDDHLGIAVALALESALGGWRPPPGL